jgi:hypothetical protein
LRNLETLEICCKVSRTRSLIVSFRKKFSFIQEEKVLFNLNISRCLVCRYFGVLHETDESFSSKIRHISFIHSYNRVFTDIENTIHLTHKLKSFSPLSFKQYCTSPFESLSYPLKRRIRSGVAQKHLLRLARNRIKNMEHKHKISAFS